MILNFTIPAASGPNGLLSENDLLAICQQLAGNPATLTFDDYGFKDEGVIFGDFNICISHNDIDTLANCRAIAITVDDNFGEGENPHIPFKCIVIQQSQYKMYIADLNPGLDRDITSLALAGDIEVQPEELILIFIQAEFDYMLDYQVTLDPDDSTKTLLAYEKILNATQVLARAGVPKPVRN